MTGVFIAHRDALVRLIADALPGVEVKAFSGRFTRQSVADFTVRAPAVRVGLAGWRFSTPLSSGEIEVELVFVAAVVTNDKPGLDRDTAALDLVERLSTAIRRQQPGTPGVKVLVPTRLRADNLYDGKLQQTAVALWQVSWQSPIVIGLPDRIDTALDDFLSGDPTAVARLTTRFVPDGPGGAPVEEMVTDLGD